MGDIDIALFIGLFASGIAYFLLAFSLNLDAEASQAQEDARELGVESVSFAQARR